MLESYLPATLLVIVEVGCKLRLKSGIEHSEHALLDQKLHACGVSKPLSPKPIKLPKPLHESTVTESGFNVEALETARGVGMFPPCFENYTHSFGRGHSLGGVPAKHFNSETSIHHPERKFGGVGGGEDGRDAEVGNLIDIPPAPRDLSEAGPTNHRTIAKRHVHGRVAQCLPHQANLVVVGGGRRRPNRAQGVDHRQVGRTTAEFLLVGGMQAAEDLSLVSGLQPAQGHNWQAPRRTPRRSVINGVAGLHTQGDGLAHQGLRNDLHGDLDLTSC